MYCIRVYVYIVRMNRSYIHMYTCYDSIMCVTRRMQDTPCVYVFISIYIL